MRSRRARGGRGKKELGRRGSTAEVMDERVGSVRNLKKKNSCFGPEYKKRRRKISCWSLQRLRESLHWSVCLCVNSHPGRGRRRVVTARFKVRKFAGQQIPSRKKEK